MGKFVPPIQETLVQCSKQDAAEELSCSAHADDMVLPSCEVISVQLPLPALTALHLQGRNKSLALLVLLQVPNEFI